MSLTHLHTSGWIPVHFTESEITRIQQVGASRRGAKAASGMDTTTLQHSHQKGVYGQQMGFAAEYALAKLLGLAPDTRIRKGGNSGVHLSLRRPRTQRHEAHTLTFNAAWVSDPTYDLRFGTGQVPPVDVFVLTTGRLPTLYLVGCISRRKFKGQAKLVDYGHGERLSVPQSELSPISSLIQHLGLTGRERALRRAYRQYRATEVENYGALFSQEELKAGGSRAGRPDES